MKELHTQRLYLRHLTEADTQRIFDCWASDPQVTEYMTWTAHKSVETTRGYMRFILDEYKKEDCYRWGIELSATGELIGMIDVVDFEEGSPAVGYCSGRAYWGNGYMTEALKAVCAYLFEEGYETILIEAADANIGSNRVIRKSGFTFTGSKVSPLSGMKKDRLLKINSYRLDKSK